MRNKCLLVITILLFVSSACNLSSPESLPGASPTETTSQVSTPTAFIPPIETEAIETAMNTQVAPTAQAGSVIDIANAQALQLGAQVTQSQASDFSWLPDSAEVALAVDQGIMIYAVDPSTVTDHIAVPSPNLLQSSPQTSLMAWVSQEQTIQIFNTRENRQVAEIQSPAGPVTSLAFSDQSDALAYATFDNHLQVWDAQNGKIVHDWQFPYWLTNLSFSPDGSILAGADLPNFMVHLIDLETGEEQRVLRWTEHASPALYSVSFSPDWKYLAWAARGTVLVMDVASGEPVVSLSHEDFVSAMAWSVDGSLIATAAAGTVNGQFGPLVSLWEAASGKLINQLVQPASVLSMSFSPDGRELAVLTNGGALQVWSVAP